MMTSAPIGSSFDPTRQAAGPQAATPGQALQIISMHLPKQFGRGIPDQLTSAPSHVGQSPEALILASLLHASQQAGTMGAGEQPTNGVTDLLQTIAAAMGQGNAPGQVPAVPPAPTVPPKPDWMPTPGPNPAPPSWTPPPPVAPGAPHITPITPVQSGPGLLNHAPGGSPTNPPVFSGGSPFFGRG